MKFYTLFLNECPRLDITGLTVPDTLHRAAKVLGPRELKYHREQGTAVVKQVQLQVMV
jgi:hypothetical protein